MQKIRFDLKTTDNVFSCNQLNQQLELPQGKGWTFQRKKVLILDLDDSQIILDELNNTPEIRKQLDVLKSNGVALCIVTNNTILYKNPENNNIEKRPEAKKLLETLHRNFPQYFDLFLFDSEPNKTFPFIQNDHKKAMLDACKKAYSADTSFCYIGGNTTIIDHAKSVKMRASHIFKTEKGSAAIPTGQDEQSKLLRLNLLASTLMRAAEHFSSNNNAPQDSRAQSQFVPQQPAASSRGQLNTQGFAPTRFERPANTSGQNSNFGKATSFQSPSTGRSGVPRYPGKYSGSSAGGSERLQSSQTKDAGRFSSERRSSTDFVHTSSRSTSDSKTKQFKYLPGQPIGTTELKDWGDFNDSSDSDAEKAPITAPSTVASRFPKEWFFHHFINAPFLTEAPKSEGNTFREAIKDFGEYLYQNLVLAPLKALAYTFPFDGLDPITGQISYASGAKQPEPYQINSVKDISLKLLITAMLGLPSRAIKGSHGPTITLVQIGKNFVGGIDWESDTPADKKKLQLFGIPVKALLILPIKLVTLLFKAIINGVKLLTEFLPWLASILTYVVYQIPLLGSAKTSQWMNSLRETSDNLARKGGAASQVESKGTYVPIFFLFLLSSALGIVSIPLFFLHCFTRVVMVTGRAITSPLINLRKAYTLGSELRLPVGTEESKRRVASFIGVIAAGLSLLVTAITWAIVFPLFVNYAIANMPTLMSMVNGIIGSQPVVAGLFALQGATTAVGAFLHTAFTGFITSLSNFVGVQITYTAIVAVSAIPFLLTLTALTDYLSGRWANWHEGSLFKPKPVQSPSDGPSPNYSPTTGKGNFGAPTQDPMELMKEGRTLLNSAKQDTTDLERQYRQHQGGDRSPYGTRTPSPPASSRLPKKQGPSSNPIFK